MKKIFKMYSKLNEYETLKHKISKAKETFEMKPFVKEFSSIEKIVNLARVPLSLFSIVTGFGFFYFQLERNLGVIPAVMFAISLLLLVELLKSEFGLLAFKRLYQTGFNSLNMILLLFLVLFFGLSVLFSVLGAKDIYKQLDNSKQAHTKKSTTQLDSISKHYDKLLSAEKKELANFKKSVSWNDKINIYDATTKNTIELHNSNISRLNTEKSKALAKIENKNDKEFSYIEASSNYNLFFWLGLSSTIEVLILGCLWFTIWFAYKVDKESEIMNNENFTLSKNDLQTYFNNNLLNLLGTHQNSNHLLLNIQNHNDTNKNRPHENSGGGVVGFSLKNNNTTKIIEKNQNTENDKKIVVMESQNKDVVSCKHCEKPFTKNHKKQIYCSNECRISNWELNKGKKLKFKK